MGRSARLRMIDSKDTESDHEDEDCGLVEACMADPLARTLFVRTDSHGMTLDWPAGLDEEDLPLKGATVTKHWVDEVAVQTGRGLAFFRVRHESPRLDTDAERVKDATVVGIGASLFAAAVVAAWRIVGRALGWVGGINDSTSPLIDFAVLGTASACLLLLREVAKARSKSRVLGLLRRHEDE